MKSFKQFILVLAATFALPWFLLVVQPVLKYHQLKQVAYDKDKDGVDGVYPPASINRQGQIVYISEGCAQCHTQVIRPTQFGMDGWRKGWGKNQDKLPEQPVRSAHLMDYLGEPYALLGFNRIGPDLSNVGWRLPESRNEVHAHLYAPKAFNVWSIMPAHRHLYKVQKIQGPISNRALSLPEGFNAQAGYEIIPTQQAELLVDYLYSLKKEQPLPASLGLAPSIQK
jgi:cytochrome c oxidase cbb3-type subunit 2